MKLVYYDVFLVLCMVACATTTINSKSVQFSDARRIIPGKTTGSELKTLFGSPDSVQSLEKGMSVWEYLRKDVPSTRRFYVFLRNDSKKVESVTWNVFEQDPESDLTNAKIALENPVLTGSRQEWTNGDAAPHETHYKNAEKNITIVLHEPSNRVTEIMWR
ncbi:MAG: hypothetical protein A2583_07630 [Bdellovibrionales bacterium RIFOXYD1_FULL_53_11]|nr:MAG: hypothetical protein A2583_07630 [Bdellovibrionales bacterium RIFOXYD1_FULL_53_11]